MSNLSTALPTRVVRSVARDARRPRYVRTRVTGRRMLAGRSNATRAAITASAAGF
jgi:hypothetical protein